MKNLIQSILILIPVLISTTGAEKVIYAQVGGKVELPLLGNIEESHYVYCYFQKESDHPLASYHPFRKYTVNDSLPVWKSKCSWTGNVLVINNIQQENFGTFIFKITQSIGTVLSITKYKVLKINVSLKPDTPLLLGESLNLACDPEASPGQKPQIYWLDPQKTKLNNGKYKVTATNQHNGKWTCVVTNNGKKSEAEISVTVIDLSAAPSHPQYTSKSSPLTIPCSLLPHISWKHIRNRSIEAVHWSFSPKPSSSPEAPQILFTLSLGDKMTWEKLQSGGLIPAPNPNEGNLSLTKHKTTEINGGNYVCTLKFKNGQTLTRTVQVEVLEIISSGTEFISGQRVNLTCSTGRALPPDLQLKWIRPKSSSLQIPDPHPAHLIIPVVGTGDSGKWQCELWRNDTKLTSAVILLKIEPRLSVWMLVTICGATVIAILICILVLILYRRRQRKMRYLRHRVCRCKNPKPRGFYVS